METPLKVKRWPIKEGEPLAIPVGKFARCPKCRGAMMSSYDEVSCVNCGYNPASKYTPTVHYRRRQANLFQLREVH